MFDNQKERGYQLVCKRLAEFGDTMHRLSKNFDLMTIKYETLMMNQSETLALVFNFLGWSAGMIQTATSFIQEHSSKVYFQSLPLKNRIPFNLLTVFVTNANANYVIL